MRVFLFSCLIGIAHLLFSQSDYRLTEHNLKFNFLKDSAGKTANIGDLVSLHMVMEAPDGKVLRSTYQEGKPLLFPVKVSVFEGDLYEAVSLMSNGDSAAFLIRADSMYAKVFKKPLPDESMEGKDLKFTIKSIEVSSQKQYLEQQVKKREQFDDNHKAEISKHIKADDKFLKQYFESNYAGKYSITEHGVYYTLFEEGTGNKPKQGETVLFHYTCTDKNGNKIESSYDGAGHPSYFIMGDGQVIPGWEEVFKYLKTGSYAKIGVPAHMAYGPLKKGEKIPPYSILFFEVKLISSK